MERVGASSQGFQPGVLGDVELPDLLENNLRPPDPPPAAPPGSARRWADLFSSGGGAPVPPSSSPESLAAMPGVREGKLQIPTALVAEASMEWSISMFRTGDL